MKITGAVLEQIGAPAPYAQSAPISVTELELDPPQRGEILVKIEAAGVCHSDLSVVDGSRLRPVPMLLGHEAAGRVVGTGDDVDLAIGQRVVMTFLPRCGECAACATGGRLPCQAGSASNGVGELIGGGRRLRRGDETINHHLGVSGFADHAVVSALSVVPVDDDVPPEVAAVLGCAVLTGGGAVINAGQPQDGDDVIVVGLGGVGMAAVMVARSRGLGKVIGVDAMESKFDAARDMGAHVVYTPDEALAHGVKAAVVVEAAGNVRAFETAIALTAPGGITVTAGLPDPAAMAHVSPTGLTAEARRIAGSYLGSAVPSRDIPTYVDQWRAGQLPVEKLISSAVGLDAINTAMDRLSNGDTIRQIVQFS